MSVFLVLEKSLNSSFLRNFSDGDVVFIKPEFIRDFARNLFPRMNTSCIIVTHNSDAFMPR